MIEAGKSECIVEASTIFSLATFGGR